MIQLTKSNAAIQVPHVSAIILLICLVLSEGMGIILLFWLKNKISNKLVKFTWLREICFGLSNSTPASLKLKQDDNDDDDDDDDKQ